MAVNRVDFGGNTLIDLTGDTLESAEQLLKGIIAHAKDGSVITGQMEAGGGGGGGGGIVYTSGTLVFSSSTICKDYELTHGLGQIPQIFIIVSKYQGSEDYSLFFYSEISESLRNVGYGADRFCYVFANHGVGMYQRIGIAGNAINAMDENKITFRGANNSYFNTNLKYSWFAVGGIAV